MQFKATMGNRREEPRYRTLAGQRMTWAKERSLGANRKGWLLDISKNGLGLMIERDKLPQVGEQIDVKLKPTADPLSYEVTRIQDGDQKIVVVGCKRMFGRAAALDMPEPAWSMSNAA